MGAGEISIQRQRMLAFGDTLSRALRKNVEESQVHMAAGMVRDRRQGLVNFASAAANTVMQSATNKFTPATASVRADPTSASTLPGSAASARSKKLRACATWPGV